MISVNNLQRKSRLSLNKNFPWKKQNEELSQNYVKSVHTSSCTNNVLENSHTSNNNRSDRSPPLISMSSDDCLIENTPPRQRKMTNLDDSLDYENNCFSPSLLMSQTVTIESPEIGWKWDCSSNKESKIGETTKSEVNNKGYSTTPVRLKCNEMRRQLRMKQRSKLEQELRKERRMQTEKTLQERCAKLQEQLKLNHNIIHNGDKTTCTEVLTNNTNKTLENVCKSEPTLVNYFDDSISDDILIAATQEVEAHLSTTQNFLITSNCELPIALEMPSSSNTKKQCSSHSSKFFTDDDADDWIFEIDENTFQSKSKPPLQRYKSLPVNSRNINNNINNNTNILKRELVKSEDLNSKKLKRHVSTNSLSTAITKFQTKLLAKKDQEID